MTRPARSLAVLPFACTAALAFVPGCSDVADENDGTASEGGDGDGDGDGDGAGDGDGDGDGSGDGDGDGDGTGDGDGDGDGTGDGDGDGDGDGTGECAIFPADNPWNTDISDYPVHANSIAYINSIGADTTLHPDFGTEWEGVPNGIPYVYVGADQPLVDIEFEYADESDPGPYPIPPDAPIEGGPDGEGDRHVLVVQTDDCLLYEVYAAYPQNGGESWTAGSGALFDLASNELRPEGWTSADAAGLPIYPGLVRYEEVVEEGVIEHALRFTVSQSQRGYIHPATHFASDDTNPDLPPMGLRLRMKADYDCSGLSDEAQVICDALKTYGMFVADNGSDWYISGAPNPAFDDDALADLSEIPGNAFEAVDTGEIITD